MSTDAHASCPESGLACKLDFRNCTYGVSSLTDNCTFGREYQARVALSFNIVRQRGADESPPDGNVLMRMLVASPVTETNTFSPLPVDRRAFERAFYASPGKHPQTPTLCSATVVAARRRAKSDDFTLIEGTSTWAEPAGLVSCGGYESLRDEILGQLRAAMPVDIALFGLHGAMVADANGLAITPHGKTTMSRARASRSPSQSS